MTGRSFARTRRPPVLLEGVTFTYPGAETPTLRDVHLHVGAGEFVSVVGASGAGKSTLLRVLTGQLRPEHGRAVVAALDLGAMPARHLPRLRRRIAVTFQDVRLLEGRTAAGNIAYALELAGTGSRKARVRAVECLEQVGVGQLADRLPHQLSGGEAQRVQLARAIANSPQVLLADEPTGNLDPETTEGIVDCLAGLADAGTAVVMVTHDVAAVDRLSRRVVRLREGAIVEDVMDARYENLASSGAASTPQESR